MRVQAVAILSFCQSNPSFEQRVARMFTGNTWAFIANGKAFIRFAYVFPANIKAFAQNMRAKP
jgi:hypothetical protein